MAFLRRYAKRVRPLRFLARWYRAVRLGRPNWGRLVARDRRQWAEARASSRRAPKVLIATSVGSFLAGSAIESTLAAALTLRGADAHVLLCDAALPACQAASVTAYPDTRMFAAHGPQAVDCVGCFLSGATVYGPLGVRVHRMGRYLTEEERSQSRGLAASIPLTEIKSFSEDGLPLGEQAYAGALRFYARGNLEGEPHGEAVLRRYFEAALLTARVMRRLLGRVPFECVVLHHGIYVPQGIVSEVSQRSGVRVVTWHPAYRKRCFIFSHGDTYHHTMMNEPTATWEQMPWSEALEQTIIGYLNSRRQGTRDWISFLKNAEEDVEQIRRELGIDFSRPTIGMLTNVMWDAQLHYPVSAFPNMLDWALKTIAYFARRPELQLMIRVHPAEVTGVIVSRQPLIAEIRKACPRLPENVFIIPPERKISTYVVADNCNAVIIYGTKMGVELASLGIPVIVAGEAWARNKGFTLDARSEDEYYRLLDQLPLSGRMDEATVQRARKYAYHFFYRRMIPLEFVIPTGSIHPPYTLAIPSLDRLRPGASRGLDVICNGILEGREFVYGTEELAHRPAIAAP